MAHNVLRASVTADSLTTEGGPATVLIDGADSPITANGLQNYTPTPGDRLLVVVVGGVVEIVQFISRGTIPSVGGISTYRQSAAPTGTIDTGSVWWDDDGLEHRWDGAAWVAITAGTSAITPGAITDDLVALNGLNPVKGITDMRPGAFTCLIHDWRFRDTALNASRFGSSTSITLETITEEIAHPYAGNGGRTMGVVGATAPPEYTPGSAITFGTVIHDTFNFADNNVVPMAITGTLNTGDTVVSVTLDAAALSKVGMTAWTGIATTYLNLDPATQNDTLVNANGVEGRTRIEWLHSDGTTVIYSTDDTGDPTFDYYGHYNYAVMESNNFSTGAIGALVPTYIRVSMIWEGPAVTADTAGHWAFILPGFSAWYIGGPSYPPGTPYVKMDHDLPVEEVALLEGLPVTAGDTYSFHCRRNPWSESIPYTGSNTSPEGGGEVIIRIHFDDGSTQDHGPGDGTGSFEAAGWQHQSDNLTMPEGAVSLDVVLHQDPADPGNPWDPFGSQLHSVDHFILPRLTISGWGGSFILGPGAQLDDGGLLFQDSDGVQAIRLDATNNSGGAALSGFVAIGPRNPGTEGFVDRDSSINMWSGGNDIPEGGGTSQPDRVGIALDPYYNTVKNGDAPFGIGGGTLGSAGARMQMSADRGTTGTDATKGFVGVTVGGTPNTGATAVETGFVFDSDTNTITPVGTLAAGGRIPGEVIMWPSPVLPTNWLRCDGSAVEGFTTYPQLHDAMHIELDVDGLPGFAAGSTTFTVTSGDLADVQVGWQIASVAIGGTNISTITAKTSTTFTIATPTAFGGPASFWVYPFGVASFGSGFVNFNLPNFTDRFPMGAGGTRKLGDQGGAETHTLTTAEMPGHTHGVGTLADSGHWHNAVTPDGTLTGDAHTHGNGTLGLPFEFSANGTTGGTSEVVHDIQNLTGGGGTNATGPISGSTASTTPGVSGHTATGNAALTGSTASAGSGSAHSILNPLEATNFIIYTGA